VFKDFPLPSHKLAPLAHEAARCAGALGEYWPYHDRLFAAQPNFERDDLLRYASELGLPRDAFVACLDAHRFAPAVQADLAEGRALGVRSTPSFLINGRPVIGAQPIDVFRTAIDEALRETR
jgi:protein-disulfide isomerase